MQTYLIPQADKRESSEHSHCGTLNLSFVNGFNDKTLSKLGDILEPHLGSIDTSVLKVKNVGSAEPKRGRRTKHTLKSSQLDLKQGRLPVIDTDYT